MASELGTLYVTVTASTLRFTEAMKMLHSALHGKRYQVVTGHDGVTRVHVCR